MDKNLPDGNQHFIIFKTEDNSVAVDIVSRRDGLAHSRSDGDAVRQGQTGDFSSYQEYL